MGQRWTWTRSGRGSAWSSRPVLGRQFSCLSWCAAVPAGGRHRPAVMKCLQDLRRSLSQPQANIVRLSPGYRHLAVAIPDSVIDLQSAQQTLE